MDLQGLSIQFLDRFTESVLSLWTIRAEAHESNALVHESNAYELESVENGFSLIYRKSWERWQKNKYRQEWQELKA